MKQGTILDSQIGRWLILVALFAALAALLTASVVRAQDNSMTIEHAENDEGAVAAFTAEDPEGVTPVTWAIAASGTDYDGDGPLVVADAVDADHFMIDKDGMLKFAIGTDEDPPDFEAPRGTAFDAATNTNTYKVVVVACDVALDTDGACPASPDGQAGYHKVTVMVTDLAEKGKVSWTTDADASGTVDNPKLMQFQVGTLLTASATDGDIAGPTKDVPNPIWRWYRGGSIISGTDAEDNTYTVTTADVNSRLRVMVTYTIVGSTTQENASLTSDYPVVAIRAGANELKFDSTTVSREVDEGKKGMMVGAPVTATGNHGAVNYALAAGGADNAKFKIDQKTGQITTDADLDFEAAAAEDNCVGNDDECIVTVTATDASVDEVAAEATVTIKITDVNEKPMFPTAALTRIEVVENMTALAAEADVATVTYTADDPEGRSLTHRLMGDDASKFELSDMQVLSFKEKPDYEMPGDANKDNVYEVTVRASDGTMHADRMVEVTVMDVDEAPEIIQGGLAISGSSSKNVSEGETDAVATFTARGPMKDRASWTLEGADSMYFSVSPARGAMTELMFRSAPDYEMPRGMAMSDANTNTYMVTLKANDATYMDTHDVTVMVTDMEEDGTVALSSMTPVVGTAVTATLTDPDMPVSVMWQWSRSMTMDGTFSDISGATMMSYTPVPADEGYYLRATATYTDGYDSGNEEMATTTSAVVSNRAPEFTEATTDREVAENTAAGMDIGAPVEATDPDGDTLTYSLSGTDAASFDIGESTGQLMTKAGLDYETKMSYMVTVTATDPDGETDSIDVTINVTDVDEGPVQRYDANNDGNISIAELFSAIDAYFAERISIADLFKVIDAYFASNG